MEYSEWTDAYLADTMRVDIQTLSNSCMVWTAGSERLQEAMTCMACLACRACLACLDSLRGAPPGLLRPPGMPLGLLCLPGLQSA